MCVCGGGGGGEGGWSFDYNQQYVLESVDGYRPGKM